MAIWNASDYSQPFTASLRGDRQASCATKKATDPAEVYFKSQNADGTWPADGDAALAASITDAPKACHFLQGETGRIILTNGFDVIRYSDAGGIAGSWNDLP